jgi:SAM-dependent methyltransferase
VDFYFDEMAAARAYGRGFGIPFDGIPSGWRATTGWCSQSAERPGIACTLLCLSGTSSKSGPRSGYEVGQYCLYACAEGSPRPSRHNDLVKGESERTEAGLSSTGKQRYYRGREMPSGLAGFYFREFGDARRILDVGCGTGALGRHRPSPDIEIHGVDVDPAALRQAARFEVVQCVNLDSSPLPYPDASFDAVLAKDVFEHVQDPSQLTREIYRVIRPGGRLLASVVMARPRAVWGDYTHVRGFTKHSAQLLLEDAGYQVLRVWRMGGVPLSNRLHLTWLLPHLLRAPILNQLYATSWELNAVKASTAVEPSRREEGNEQPQNSGTAIRLS